jgi:soluble lytic murein transglycosylase
MAKFLTLCSVIFLLSATAYPASNANFRETYAEGRKFMQQSQWEKALKNFQALEKDYTLLNDYILFDMSACYEKSGEKDKAVACLRKIASNFKNSSLYRKAFRRILEIEKGGDLKVVLTDYDFYLREFPQDSKTVWEKADLLEKSGMNEEALLIWKEIFLSGSAYALTAYEALKANNRQPSRGEIKLAASRLLEKENYQQAAALLEYSPPKEEEGKYLLARAYFRLRRYRDTARMLSGISFKDSKYLLALSLIRTNEKDAFYKLIDGAKQGQKDLFSLHSMAAELKRRDGNIAESLGILQSMQLLYPEREEEITWCRAWTAIREGQLVDAEGLLAGLAERSSKEQDKYLFWLGKVKTYQGQSGEVFFSQIKDQSGYYWFKAGNKGKNPLSDNGLKDAKKESLLPLPEEINRSMLRIAELESLKMRTEATQEARFVIGSVTEPYVFTFARQLAAIEDYYSLVKLGTRYNAATLKYPLAFRDKVFAHASTQKIDPLLVTALMREESRFRNDAVSGAGAIGVMQLMPATARRVAHIRNNEELYDAEKNIGLGTNYLAQLVTHFKLLPYAVAAYNAGEHNVEKWLAAGYRDEDEFAEDIPFGETKSYVFRVLKTYGIMKSLYGNKEE